MGRAEPLLVMGQRADAILGNPVLLLPGVPHRLSVQRGESAAVPDWNAKRPSVSVLHQSECQRRKEVSLPRLYFRWPVVRDKYSEWTKCQHGGEQRGRAELPDILWWTEPGSYCAITVCGTEVGDASM